MNKIWSSSVWICQADFVEWTPLENLEKYFIIFYFISFNISRNTKFSNKLLHKKENNDFLLYE